MCALYAALFLHPQRGSILFRVVCCCPACKERIRFKAIFFALNPVWIRCPACGAKLIGNGFVKAQGVAVYAIVVAAAVPACLWVFQSFEPWTARILGCLVVALALGVAIGAPMTLLTLKRGGYVERSSSPQQEEPPDAEDPR